MKVTGTAALQKSLRDYAKEMNRTTQSVLRQEARSLCVDLSFKTDPYGFGDPHAVFMARITGDIRKVFTTMKEVWQVTELIKPRSHRLAMAFWSAMKKGDEARARKYMRQAGINVESLDRILHRTARTGKRGSVAKNATPKQIVKEATREKYVIEKQKTIGTAKAGWYAAAIALGGRVRTGDSKQIVPKFIRRLASKWPGLGGATVSSLRVEVFTNVTHGDEALQFGALDTAVQSSREKLIENLQKTALKIKRQAFKQAA